MTVRNPKKTRPGFTLVEMLTVIVIIGILAALTLGAGIAVRAMVRRSIVISDIKQLEIGLQKYKGDKGELPPDFAFCDETSTRGVAARARVVRHLRKAFPRMKLPGATTDAQYTVFLGVLNTNCGITPADLNPSTALTFWLGGIPDADGKPKGFHEDVTNPFKAGEPRTTPYYDFDVDRLDGLQLTQPGIRPASPIVYFRAVKNNTTGNFEYGAVNDTSGEFEPFSFPYPATSDDYCVPYLEDAYDLYPAIAVNGSDPTIRQRTWRAAESYQIIAAGLDGKFSNSTPVQTPPTTPPGPPYAFRFSKVGERFSDADYDNLTSFAQGELEDEL